MAFNLFKKPTPAPEPPKVPEKWELQYSLKVMESKVEKTVTFCTAKIKEYLARYMQYSTGDRANPQMAARMMKQISMYKKEINAARYRYDAMLNLYDQYDLGLDSVGFQESLSGLLASFNNEMNAVVFDEVPGMIENIQNIGAVTMKMDAALDNTAFTFGQDDTVTFTEADLEIKRAIDSVYEMEKIAATPSSQQALIDKICQQISL